MRYVQPSSSKGSAGPGQTLTKLKTPYCAMSRETGGHPGSFGCQIWTQSERRGRSDDTQSLEEELECALLPGLRG
eukprot:3939787-Rhodomonas_salina.1